jgi:hypothetical protein
MNIEDVEKLMDDTAEALAYQKVSSRLDQNFSGNRRINIGTTYRRRRR